VCSGFFALAVSFGFAENFKCTLRKGQHEASTCFQGKRLGKLEKACRISGRAQTRVLL